LSQNFSDEDVFEELDREFFGYPDDLTVLLAKYRSSKGN
jgi:hypothetical protein